MLNKSITKLFATGKIIAPKRASHATYDGSNLSENLYGNTIKIVTIANRHAAKRTGLLKSCAPNGLISIPPVHTVRNVVMMSRTANM